MSRSYGGMLIRNTETNVSERTEQIMYMSLNRTITLIVEAAEEEKNAPQGWGRYHSQETVRNPWFAWTADR